MQTKQQQTTVYLDTPELKVYTDLFLNVVVIQGHGVVSSTVYRHGLSLAAKIAIREQLLYWMVNNRDGGIITPEDQIWTSDVVAPQLASESCIRKMAFIEPKDCHSKIILEDMMNKARDIFPFEMQFFEDTLNARSWFMDTQATAFITAVPSRAIAAGRPLDS